jgi:Hexameric tyrosine-coordinated heme protein (HTHP)
MAQAPAGMLVPGNSLIIATVEEGRALAITLARHSIQAMQHDEDVLKTGRAQYANDPHWLIAASHVNAVEFATIATVIGTLRQALNARGSPPARPANGRLRCQLRLDALDRAGAEANDEPQSIRATISAGKCENPSVSDA